MNDLDIKGDMQGKVWGENFGAKLFDDQDSRVAEWMQKLPGNMDEADGIQSCKGSSYEGPDWHVCLPPQILQVLNTQP